MMAGSSFGKAFQVITWGESHGKALGVVVQGCPPGVSLDESILQRALDKRKPGQGSAGTKRKEPDKPEILSGLFEGKTTGTPISILIRNHDAKSRDYSKIADLFRPGHGDITYQAKYGIRDYRGGGRSSARETAARVAAGAVAEAFLAHAAAISNNGHFRALDGINHDNGSALRKGDFHENSSDHHGFGHHRSDIVQPIVVDSMTLALGGVQAKKRSRAFAMSNSFEWPDEESLETVEKRIEDVKKAGDSLGGVVEITAKNIPPGLGDPVFDKLDADIAKAMMSIGAVKAVEIGAGCDAANKTGFENNDSITPDGFATNHSGGILSGISNGDDIVVRVHVKPIPSILREQQTIDVKGLPRTISTQGRHDISAIPRVNPVCRAMLYLVLADHYLRQHSIVPYGVFE